MPEISSIQQYGNQLLVQYDDGTNALAYPTVTDVWLMGVIPTGGGGGAAGISWPFGLAYVVSEFGPRNGSFHEGMDFSGGPATLGHAMPAAGAGTVVLSQWYGGYGNCVIIDHGAFDGKTLTTLYGHMQAPSPMVVGQSVTKAQTIGAVGNTGNSYGAHLHWETTIAGKKVNPRDFMALYGDGGTIYA